MNINSHQNQTTYLKNFYQIGINLIKYAIYNNNLNELNNIPDFNSQSIFKNIDQNLISDYIAILFNLQNASETNMRINMIIKGLMIIYIVKNKDLNNFPTITKCVYEYLEQTSKSITLTKKQNNYIQLITICENENDIRHLFSKCNNNI